jgi:hypothetical protein
VLGIRDPAGLTAAYADMAGRLGPAVLVCETAGPGTELALGITRDPDLGPLVVAGAGWPAGRVPGRPGRGAAAGRPGGGAADAGRLRVAGLLAGVRGQPPADTGAIAEAVGGGLRDRPELGDSPGGARHQPADLRPVRAVAVDVLAVRRARSPAHGPAAHAQRCTAQRCTAASSAA